MGNIESSSKVNVGQLQGLSPRELNISRSLAYEEYQQVTIIGSVSYEIIWKIASFGWMIGCS